MLNLDTKHDMQNKRQGKKRMLISAACISSNNQYYLRLKKNVKMVAAS